METTDGSGSPLKSELQTLRTNHIPKDSLLAVLQGIQNIDILRQGQECSKFVHDVGQLKHGTHEGPLLNSLRQISVDPFVGRRNPVRVQILLTRRTLAIFFFGELLGQTSETQECILGFG